MANEETVKYFNIKNTSIRLVHFGGVMILPGKVKAIIDDELGINKATVEGDQFLEITEDEADSDETEVEETKPVRKSTAKAAAKTPTGAGWNAKG